MLFAGPFGGRARLALGGWFVAGVLVSAAWGGVAAAAYGKGGLPLAVAANLLDLSRYAAWFGFTLWLLRRQEPGRGQMVLLRGLVILATLFGAAGAATGALPFATIAFPVVGLVLIEQVSKGAAEDARWHLKPLCLGLAAIFVFDLYLHSYVLLFGRPDDEAAALRGAVHALPVALLYVSVQRQANWRGSLRVSRDAAFHTVTLILVGIYLLLISASGYYVRKLGGDWGGALQIILVSVSLVALTALALSGAMRARLRVFVSKHFFRYRYDYRTEWLRFTARLGAERSPREVGGLVVQGLAEMLHSPAGALWYRDSQRALLVQAARWNSPVNDNCEAEDSAFARLLLERQWGVDLSACRGGRESAGVVSPPTWLLENQAYWLVVPLIVGSRLVGFVVIEPPHAMTALNWEVRDLLKTASRQAASFLAMIHATEALLEARKFEAFNKMSAFVVHDLKNVVAQLSLMTQNARRLKDNPEFQEDMLATVENSLEKMRRLMHQLRSSDTPAGTGAGVALPAVVDRVRAAAEARGRALAVQFVDRVVARGAEQRVERVIGHLVDNALDATAPNGTVTITLSREGSQAKVAVCDNGHGMSREFIATELFKPFHSTKSQGMGIGAYESRQYIHEIGGSLTVESEVGRGTTVVVSLPLLETGQGAIHELHGER